MLKMMTKTLFHQLFCLLASLSSVSQVTYCAKIPAEETLVFPKLLESRNDKGTKVLKINDALTLNLEKSSVISDEFLLRTYQGHVMQHTYLDGQALEEDLYHDPHRFASVFVSEENGLEVEGVLGPKFAIKPLKGQGRSAGVGDVPHVIYKIEDHEGVFARTDGTEQERAKTNISERQNQNSARPGIIYPELLIIVDSTLRAQFSTEFTLLKYLIITLNSVNVRYLTVSDPAVRIKFRAMEVLTPAAETFLTRSGNYVQGIRSLQGLRDYVHGNPDKYGIYDGVYLVTGLDMAEYTYHGWNGNLLGYAYIGGICSWQKVGYGEDAVGTFKGIRILAHEFGHLLGCPHDGTSSGYYTSVSCPWNDGFLMSYMEADSRSMKFSHCCNQMISLLVWSERGKCLLTNSAKRKIKKKYYVKFFVGNILTRDQICKLSFPNVAETRFMKDYHGNENCMARCFMPKSIYGYDTYLPTFLPDNSPCKENNGTICRNGDCVRQKLRRYQYRPY
ncbi:venom metalloproteinase BumaMPs1-like [Dermacentor andersoni]|uniref:venom metalloproteinase BumaMPs1-like n=1 Tax=Dermacentor andersoni TaxID=34620 RepID=UPI0021550476|nr:venom metalloproteinase BumaMPs1-like [Dermacentor andersoni]